MAFDLDLSHIPNIPGLPTNALPLDTGVSSTTKVILDKITSDPGSLFANPMVNSINTLGGATDIIEQRIRDIADGVSNNASITDTDAQNYLATNGIQDLRTSMGNFLMHTNQLSGLLQSQGINSPGLQQIMTIGLQMQNMMTLVNGASGCLTALGGATGLFSGDALNSSASSIAQLVDKIDRGLADITEIAEEVIEIKDLISGIIDKDSRFLQQCVNQLQSAAVGLAMEAVNANPCMKFLFENISNRNPGGIVNILSNPIAG